MAKKIIVTGKSARQIDVSGKAQQRIEPGEFATAIGAEAIGNAHGTNIDAVSLGALGNELINRLRSTGGRPALVDATEICRVPLSVEDFKALENLTDQIARTTGTKPSPGQVASVLVRQYLKDAVSQAEPSADQPKSKWPKDWTPR